MKHILKLLAVLAVAGGLAACDKEPEAPAPAPTDFSGGCEAVDLGLSVKWASYNVGATAPTEKGSHFAWGEVRAKEFACGWSKEGDYAWGIYDENAKPLYGMTKYTADVEGGDGLKTLLPEDDAATMNWGTKWRTPTFEEMKELTDDTKCKWVLNEDRTGYTVTSLKTGRSIFLPAAGHYNDNGLNESTNYMSSSVNTISPKGAYIIWFVTDDFRDGLNYCPAVRYYSRSVRAVTDY